MYKNFIRKISDLKYGGKIERRRIYGALVANIAVAVVKFIAASVTGSSAILSEGIHSTLTLAMNYCYCGESIKFDEMHPFGYRQELYFYTLIVSVLIFGLGGGMSVYEGIMHITPPVMTADPTWNYIVRMFGSV